MRLKRGMLVAAGGRVWKIHTILKPKTGPKMALLHIDYRREPAEWVGPPYLERFPLRDLRRVRAR